MADPAAAQDRPSITAETAPDTPAHVPASGPGQGDVSPVGLSVECCGLTLASPTDDDVAALMDVYAHDFDFSGTTHGKDIPDIHDIQLDRVRRDRHPEATKAWNLHLVAKDPSGDVVGWATLGLTDDRKRRVLESTSWVVEALRNRGNGTSIRHGVLALAFDGLGAEVAVSSPLMTNGSSHRVSSKFPYKWTGYRLSTEPNSDNRFDILELTKAAWATVAQPAQLHGHNAIRDWLDADVYQ